MILQATVSFAFCDNEHKPQKFTWIQSKSQTQMLNVWYIDLHLGPQTTPNQGVVLPFKICSQRKH